MIEPQPAAVRPRVLSAAGGEALLLEDEVRRLLDAGTRGVVALLGPAGSGKTAALQHLAAALPPDAPVTFLDGPDYPNWAPDTGRLVVYAPACPRPRTRPPPPRGTAAGGGAVAAALRGGG
jgi:energy-coupling factor transporter ATP-binding protein EcfA2